MTTTTATQAWITTDSLRLVDATVVSAVPSVPITSFNNAQCLGTDPSGLVINKVIFQDTPTDNNNYPLLIGNPNGTYSTIPNATFNPNTNTINLPGTVNITNTFNSGPGTINGTGNGLTVTGDNGYVNLTGNNANINVPFLTVTGNGHFNDIHFDGQLFTANSGQTINDLIKDLIGNALGITAAASLGAMILGGAAGAGIITDNIVSGSTNTVDGIARGAASGIANINSLSDLLNYLKTYYTRAQNFQSDVSVTGKLSSGTKKMI